VELITTVAELRGRLDQARAEGRTVGAVPTMGFLHEGHQSLMRAAAADNDLVATSVFVNPLQFAPTEDLAAYPRDLDRDRRLADAAGAHLLFAPTVEEMYPEPVCTTVRVADVSARFEGATRPTHFAGVATVVAKLCNIFGPCRMYFGEKDYQQVAVVRRMVADLSFPVEVVACPTVREPDGVAMSSRNVYLTPEERAAAPVLQRALQAGVALVHGGERDPAVVEAAVEATIRAEPLAELDYAAVVDAATLAPLDVVAGEVRLLAAARFGKARLLDNAGAAAPPPDP
jgi:pantoate--beta-alanine ligase